MIEAPIPTNEPQRLDSLRKLNVLDTAIEERFERITRMVCRLLGVPIAAVSLVDEARQWFKSIQGLDVCETPRRVAFCSHTILGDDTMVVHDAHLDPRFADNPLVENDPRIASYAGHPIRATDGSKVGTLCAIDTKPRQFTPDELQTLRDLAAMVETELKAAILSEGQKELMAELDAERRRALIDPLTRLWNRAGILEIFKRELSDAARKGEPIGLFLGDIDNFKTINDTYGHPVGDTVLRETARRLVSGLRGHDAVGRFGGEEFMVIMPGHSVGQLAVVGNRLREQLNGLPVPTHTAPLRVTMSFGAVAEIPESSRRMEDLIKLADDALYHAKRSGKDRIEIAA